MQNKMRSFVIAFIIVFMPLALFAQEISGTWSTESSDGFTPSTLLTSNVGGENGRIYVIGGVGVIKNEELNTLEVFDPYSNIWMTPATTGTFIGHAGHTSSVVGTKIYVIGGGDGNVKNKDVEVFNTLANSWTTLITIGRFTPRMLLTSSVVDGKIYVIGGYDTTGHSVKSLDILDPSTNTWITPTTTGTFTPRYGLCSSVVGGKIYVIGGQNQNTPLNTLEVFDPLTNTWSTPITTGTFTPRRYLTSSVIGNKIYVMGGVDINGRVCNTLEVYDPATNTWSTPVTTGTFTPRCYLTSCSVGGKIYAMGGTGHGNIILNTHEVFTPTPVNDVNPNAAQSGISLSPNPTTGIISISNAPLNTQHISITNILGETVIELAHPQTSNFTLDLSKLPPGLYYAKFASPNSAIVKKIILQR